MALPPDPTAIRRTACMPRGVAALPSPSRLADTFPDRAARVSGSLQARGSRRPSRGRNRRLRPSISPQAFIMDMTPLHRHITPAIFKHSCTAAAAPSMAAFPTAPMVPLSIPYATDNTTIPVHTQAIAILVTLPLLFPASSGAVPLYIAQAGQNMQKKSVAFYRILLKRKAWLW